MKSMFQLTLEAALNHYAGKAVQEAIDYIASLDEDDLKEMAAHLDESYKAKAYAIWGAARGWGSSPLPSTLPPPLSSKTDPSPEKS